MGYLVAKSIEFDAGHRVPDHVSKCKNPHGHRYRVTAWVSSKVVQDQGSERGMVRDFGVIGQVLREFVHDKYDHGFMVAEQDQELYKALLSVDPTWKIIVVPDSPTAENLARWIWDSLIQFLPDLYKIEVNETPTSVAVYKG